MSWSDGECDEHGPLVDGTCPECPTEAEMIADLLDAMYLEGERRRADPATQQLERVLRDVKKAMEEDDALEDNLAGGRLGARVRAFEAARKATDAGRKITAIKPPAPKKRRKVTK